MSLTTKIPCGDTRWVTEQGWIVIKHLLFILFIGRSYNHRFNGIICDMRWLFSFYVSSIPVSSRRDESSISLVIILDQIIFAIDGLSCLYSWAIQRSLSSEEQFWLSITNRRMNFIPASDTYAEHNRKSLWLLTCLWTNPIASSPRQSQVFLGQTKSVTFLVPRE